MRNSISTIRKPLSALALAASLGVCTALAPQVLAASQIHELAAKKVEPKKGNSGIVHHGEHSLGSGPIVDKWIIPLTWGTKDGKEVAIGDMGSVNLTLDSDGSWNFSGKLNQHFLPGRVAMVFSVKSSEGTVIAFKQAMTVDPNNPSSYTWEKQGKSQIIKDNFTSFAKGHDSYGTTLLSSPSNPGSSGGSGPDFGSLLSEVVSVLGPIVASFL